MPNNLVNGVSFFATSAGTGTFVFAALRLSFLTLAQAVATGALVDGQQVSYLAQDSLSTPQQREWGHGTFSQAGNSVARTTVLGGTSGPGVPVNFLVPPIVSLTVLAEDIALSTFNQNTAFTATGRPSAADIADRWSSNYIDVKADYGAKGDGITDDTAAIQAALNAAFGTGTGTIAQTAQRYVRIPPGLYIVRGGGLTGKNWFGGVIEGAGRFTTQIQNADGGPVITTNGCQYMRFQGMRLFGTGAASTLFDLDWDGTGTALQSNTFHNMYFDTAGRGLRIANSGNMGSENLILNCFFDNLSVNGLSTVGGNALQQTVIGGNFQVCAKAIQIVQGSVNVIHGVGFQVSSLFDISIENNSQNTMSVIGCRTESPNFITNPVGQNLQISACHQQSAGARGLFYVGQGGMIHISACLFDGQVQPRFWTRLCIQACQPTREAIAGDWLIKDPPNWWYIPNNPQPLSIEIENVESFLAAGDALGLIIDKQRIYTTDGATVTTKTYTVA